MVRKIDYEKAIALRMTGKSYNEIAKDLKVAKSSIAFSIWAHIFTYIYI
jgi:DNA-binding CsgD family transcriptional regulator